MSAPATALTILALIVAAGGVGCGFSSLHANDCSQYVTFGSVDPSWSPDGRKLVFVRIPTANDCQIYVMNADGSNRRRLTEKSSYYQLGPSAWSPDGRKIAFAGGDGIYVMNSDGKKQRRLTRASASSGCTGCTSDEAAAWSPDGRRIAYDNAETGLYVMNPDGSTRQRLTPDSAIDYEPSWSADSRKVVFAHGTSRNTNFLAITDADGHNRRRLRTPDGSSSPAWSPDGREIAFVSTGDSGRHRIFIMNADGRKQRQPVGK